MTDNHVFRYSVCKKMFPEKEWVDLIYRNERQCPQCGLTYSATGHRLIINVGKLRQDDSSHWYLIPLEKLKVFDDANTDDDDAWEELEKFDCYRLPELIEPLLLYY